MKKFKPHKLPPRKNVFMSQGTSGEELDLYNTIKLLVPETQVFQSDRTILNGREIDIYIPVYKLGFEFDGLFWHCSSSGKTPDYHLYKTIEAEKKGIRLLHIWSNEWELKRSLVVDHIQKILGRGQLIDPYKCEIQSLTKSQGAMFINSCHIQGDEINSTHYYGLSYQGTVVAVASFRIEEGRWILTRYAERRLVSVTNGLALIIKHIRELKDLEVVCALDRRLYDGKDLIAIGFKEYKTSPPRKWYTQDYKVVYPEEAFLNIRESLKNKNEFKTIYDCGLKFFKLEI